MSPSAKKARAKKAAAKKATSKKVSAKKVSGSQSPRRRPKKDTTKLRRRFAIDFAAMRSVQLGRAGAKETIAAPAADRAVDQNPALLRLRALEERGATRDAAVSPQRRR